MPKDSRNISVSITDDQVEWLQTNPTYREERGYQEEGGMCEIVRACIDFAAKNGNDFLAFRTEEVERRFFGFERERVVDPCVITKARRENLYDSIRVKELEQKREFMEREIASKETELETILESCQIAERRKRDLSESVDNLSEERRRLIETSSAENLIKSLQDWKASYALMKRDADELQYRYVDTLQENAKLHQRVFDLEREVYKSKRSL